MYITYLPFKFFQSGRLKIYEMLVRKVAVVICKARKLRKSKKILLNLALKSTKSFYFVLYPTCGQKSCYLFTFVTHAQIDIKSSYSHWLRVTAKWARPWRAIGCFESFRWLLRARIEKLFDVPPVCTTSSDK